MPTSRTHVANMALRQAGISDAVGDVDTERSERARALRDFLDQAADEVLRDYDWPFARRLSDAAGLALVAADPSTEWPYGYRAPAGAVAVRRVLNGTGLRYDTRATRARYQFYADDDGGLLYTDLESTSTDPLRIVYTARVDDVTRWPPDFAAAVAMLLAMYVAPSLKENGRKTADELRPLYEWQLLRAKANAANEEDPGWPTDEGESELLRARR